MKTLSFIFFLFLLLLLAGCRSSNITSSWTTSNTPAKPYHKIMVIAVLNEKDTLSKSQIEKQLVNELLSNGVEATTITQEFGSKSFKNMKEKEIMSRLHKTGVDAVIIVTMLNKNKEKDYVPGSVNFYPSPTIIADERFRGNYTTTYNRVYAPGYYETSTDYFYETKLIDINRNKLIYSSQSKSFDPTSAEKMAAEQSKLIVGDMKKNKLLLQP